MAKSFNRFFSTATRGWFVERISDLKSAVNVALTHIERGSARTAFGLAIRGDGSDEAGRPILVDAESDHTVTALILGVTEGMGYWDVPCQGSPDTFRIYALKGAEAQNLRLVVSANTGDTWSVTVNPAGTVVTIRVPANNSGTLAGLRAAILATGAKDHFAVSGEDRVQVFATDVMASTALTPPTVWATSPLECSCAGTALPVYSISSTELVLAVPAGVFGTTLDDWVPCVVRLEVVVNDQLVPFTALASAAPVE